jgi:predicted Zn-dependent protease
LAGNGPRKESVLKEGGAVKTHQLGPRLLWCVAVVLSLAAIRAPAPLVAQNSAQKPAQNSAKKPAPKSNQIDELQIGQEVFNELKDKAEIIESSPLYDQLRPIADSITKAAQAKYNHPFKFYLVHEAKPNAFAVAGGNVYVVDAMMYFAKNTEELAGTLCHEVSHTIHHDTVTLMERRQKILERGIGAAVILGPTRAHLLAIYLIGKLHSLSYSREAESAADLTGSDICAEAGYNPWGLVWLFQDFQNAKMGQLPQLLSDHPNNPNRVSALEKHFQANPGVFGKFNSDPKSAKPLTVPKNAPVVFLR